MIAHFGLFCFSFIFLLQSSSPLIPCLMPLFFLVLRPSDHFVQFACLELWCFLLRFDFPSPIFPVLLSNSCVMAFVFLMFYDQLFVDASIVCLFVWSFLPFPHRSSWSLSSSVTTLCMVLWAFRLELYNLQWIESYYGTSAFTPYIEPNMQKCKWEFLRNIWSHPIISKCSVEPYPSLSRSLLATKDSSYTWILHNAYARDGSEPPLRKYAPSHISAWIPWLRFNPFMNLSNAH